MKPYEPNAVCPKCGESQVDTRHMPKHPFPRCGCEGLPALDGLEHLCRICRRCYYRWPEAVLEATV